MVKFHGSIAYHLSELASYNALFFFSGHLLHVSREKQRSGG